MGTTHRPATAAKIRCAPDIVHTCPIHNPSDLRCTPSPHAPPLLRPHREASGTARPLPRARGPAIAADAEPTRPHSKAPQQPQEGGRTQNAPQPRVEYPIQATTPHTDTRAAAQCLVRRRNCERQPTEHLSKARCASRVPVRESGSHSESRSDPTGKTSATMPSSYLRLSNTLTHTHTRSHPRQGEEEEGRCGCRAKQRSRGKPCSGRVSVAMLFSIHLLSHVVRRIPQE